QQAIGLALAKLDPQQAIATLEQALAVARDSGNLFWVNSIAVDIANLEAKAGEPRAALESFRRLLSDAGTMRDSFLLNRGLSALILLFERLGRPAIAAMLYGALPKSLERGGLYDELSAAMKRARTALGVPAFNTATERGAAMGLGDASKIAAEEIEKN